METTSKRRLKSSKFLANGKIHHRHPACVCRVAQRGGGRALGAFFAGVDDVIVFPFAQDDCLGRIADFPAERTRRRVPNVAGRSQGVAQILVAADLREIRLERAQIFLTCQPPLDRREVRRIGGDQRPTVRHLRKAIRGRRETREHRAEGSPAPLSAQTFNPMRRRANPG